MAEWVTSSGLTSRSPGFGSREWLTFFWSFLDLLTYNWHFLGYIYSSRYILMFWSYISVLLEHPGRASSKTFISELFLNHHGTLWLDVQTTFNNIERLSFCWETAKLTLVACSWQKCQTCWCILEVLQCALCYLVTFLACRWCWLKISTWPCFRCLKLIILCVFAYNK